MEPESKAPNDGQGKRATEYLTNECTFVGVDQNQHFGPAPPFQRASDVTSRRAAGIRANSSQNHRALPRIPAERAAWPDGTRCPPKAAGSVPKDASRAEILTDFPNRRAWQGNGFLAARTVHATSRATRQVCRARLLARGSCRLIRALLQRKTRFRGRSDILLRIERRQVSG